MRSIVSLVMPASPATIRGSAKTIIFFHSCGLNLQEEDNISGSSSRIVTTLAAKLAMKI